jgi:uncharacterized phage-like protein YoqJ
MSEKAVFSANCACFTGHRSLTEDEMRKAVEVIRRQIVTLRSRVVTHYYAGGAVGFDMLAAITVLNMKQQYPELTLTLALPCRNHADGWGRLDRELLSRVIERADEVVYVGEAYHRGCMQARNRYMVDRSSYCLAYLQTDAGGTFNTVRYAEKKGVPVIYINEDRASDQLHFL